MLSMPLVQAEKPTVEELRRDVLAAIREEFDMTVPEFVKALDSGRLSTEDDAVHDIAAWMRFLPKDDPIFRC